MERLPPRFGPVCSLLFCFAIFCSRDIETAIYNAQLYEYEKKEVDWFVEKRYLEERIDSLEEEVQKRNVLDDQIETCIKMLQSQSK